MAKADKKSSTERIWLSEAKILLAKRHGGSSRVAEELLRDTFQSDPTLWGYRKKKGDAPDGELWQSARIDFAEGCAIRHRAAADPVLLVNDDGLVDFMRPGALNTGGGSARPLVHRTEWLGIWVSRAHVLALLPEDSRQQGANDVGLGKGLQATRIMSALDQLEAEGLKLSTCTPGELRVLARKRIPARAGLPDPSPQTLTRVIKRRLAK